VASVARKEAFVSHCRKQRQEQAVTKVEPETLKKMTLCEEELES
jgi:hypothetical protein